MLYLTSFGVVWISIHLLGLAVALMVRMHLGGLREGLIQGSYLICLMMVGLTTVFGYHDCMQCWPISAITLATMIVTAVLDFGSSQSSPLNLEA